MPWENKEKIPPRFQISTWEAAKIHTARICPSLSLQSVLCCQKSEEPAKKQGYLSLPNLRPATTQNLVVKFDDEICGGVLVENASDDFPSKRSSKISCQTSPEVRHQFRRKLRQLHSGNRWCLRTPRILGKEGKTHKLKSPGGSPSERHNPLRGSPRKFASQRVLRGICGGLFKASAGSPGVVPGSAGSYEGSDPIFVPLANC